MRTVTCGMLVALVLLAPHSSEGASSRAEKGYPGQNASFPIDRRDSSSGTEKDIPPPAGSFARR